MDQTEKKPTRRSGLKEILGRNISIRLPLDLYDRIDSEWDKKGFKSKTDMIENICKEYFNSIKCPMCGTLNPPKAIRCAVCGRELKDISSKREELRYITESFFEKLKELNKIFVDIRDYYLENLGSKIDFQNPVAKPVPPIYDSLFAVVGYIVMSIERAIRIDIVFYTYPYGSFGDKDEETVLNEVEPIDMVASDSYLDKIINARIEQGEDVLQAINSEIERKRKGIEQLSIDIEISKHLSEAVKDIYKEIMEK